MSAPRIPVLPTEAARGALEPDPAAGAGRDRWRVILIPRVRDAAWMAGGVLAATLAYLHRDNDEALFQIQRIWGGLVPLLGGLLLVVVPPRWSRPRRFRVLLGSGLMLVNIVGNAPANVKLFRADGWINLINVVGLLLVMAGILDRIMLRHHLISWRAMMESLMVSSLLAVSCWQLVFRDQTPDADAGPLVGELLLTGYVVGLSVLTWSRGRDAGLSIASVGASGLIITHLITMFHLNQGLPRTWIPAAISCIAWPLVIVGLQRCGPYATVASHQRDADVEGRSLVFLSTVTVVAISGMIYITVGQPERMDAWTWICCGCFLLASWARELIRAWQAHRMFNQLASVATRDPLTGLGNLRALDDEITRRAADSVHRTERSRRAQARRQLSAMTVDLNRFKDVNDLLGRTTADELLRAIADRLTTLTEDLDAAVFRTAGNEFLVLAQGRAELVEHLAERSREAVSAVGATIPGLARIPLSAAVGVAHLPVGSAVTEDTLRLLTTQSTQAMRQAKESRCPVAVFDDSLAATQRRSWQIESVLRERLANGKGVEVHYQPIINLDDGILASVEALARWCDPRLDDVTPTEFIAVAERCGLIDRLGLQIMRDALLGARKAGLLDAGKRVAVNVSALQLRAPRFVSEVSTLLDTLAVSRKQLVIEVTESVFVSSDDPAVRALNDLHHEGISVVLDDFGTGYSSLSYLTRLPVEGLKIDRSITIDLDNTKTHAIASSIAQIAKRLDLDVVVEGVENAQQEKHVIELGLNRVQGWRYSKAVDVEGLSALINLAHLPSQLSGSRGGLRLA